MLNLVCDRSALFVKELNITRKTFLLQLVHLIFLNRDISAEDIRKGQVRARRPNDLQILEFCNDHLLSKKIDAIVVLCGIEGWLMITIEIDGEW